jgi:hypothetical protein
MKKFESKLREIVTYPELKRFDDGTDIILQDFRCRNEKGRLR